MLQVAAALSYYLVLSVFPGLMFLSAVIGSIPLPDLFGRVLGKHSAFPWRQAFLSPDCQALENADRLVVGEKISIALIMGSMSAIASLRQEAIVQTRRKHPAAEFRPSTNLTRLLPKTGPADH